MKAPCVEGRSLRLRFSFADQLQGWGRGTAGETSFWRSGTPMMLMMPGAGAGGGGDAPYPAQLVLGLEGGGASCEFWWLLAKCC